MDIGQFFQMHLWEALETPKDFNGNFTCTDLQLPNEIVKNIHQIRICRKGNYDIQVIASGTLSDPSTLQKEKNKELAGTIINGGTIICDSSYEGVITLQPCISEGYTTHSRLDAAQDVKFEATIKVFEVKFDFNFNSDSSADTLIEWYLNGVRDSFLFCDSSAVIDKVSREITSAGTVIHSLANTTENFSKDCVFIAFEDTGVLVRKVSSKYGPEWSNSISLEYRNAYGRIPNKEEREKIAELLSFLMGRHLILVGDTSYYEDSILEANMYHPHSKNAVAECRSNTKEIIPVHQYILREDTNFRTFAQALLPVYLKVRDLYDMGSVLERYWLANTMPIGVNLPILAGGIESLIKAWFKGKKSKTKGVYMDAAQYEHIINEFKEQIQEKLANCEYQRNIIGKITNAYQMGANDRYFIFLDEIGLEYGDAEKASIKGRNAFTHGDNSDDVDDTLKKTRTMYILLGRIFLKLLEYEGEYIDETLPGFPRKEINKKIN